ncbi:MAG: hypothetical protein LBD68_04665, partial [Zoogloeaceae bacterium]|nr:hypothetical protein [Zoogloeaceae bacterium]
MSFLRNLFGNAPKDRPSAAARVPEDGAESPDAPPDAGALRTEMLPPQAAGAEDERSAFICREALLGRDQKIV